MSLVPENPTRQEASSEAEGRSIALPDQPSSAVRYPEFYVWYVFLSASDVLFTSVILHLEGREVNALANWILELFNVRGLVAYKFLVVVLVICICEVVGRRNHETGLMLARWMVALAAFPLMVVAAQLLRDWVLGQL
jgi:hypothetical protein